MFPILHSALCDNNFIKDKFSFDHISIFEKVPMDKLILTTSHDHRYPIQY